MHRYARVLTLSLLALGGLSLAQEAAKPLTIGVVYVYSKLGKQDRGYNETVAEGIRRATKDFAVTLKEYVPPSNVIGSDMKAFAGAKYDLLIGIGFQNQDLMNGAAKAKSGNAYVIVDNASDQPNVDSIVFREEEGSFMVGYLAALKSTTGNIGFVGGMDIPIIQRFEAGYVAGARAANKDIKVYGAYAGKTPKAFNDPETGKSIAQTLVRKGVDIIFTAAGTTGDGVISLVNATQCLKASALPSGLKFKPDPYSSVPKSAAYSSKCGAADRPVFFIGVDSNQNYLGDEDGDPTTLNHGLSSMVKNLDVAVYSTIQEVAQGRFKGGTLSFGLNENGVGYAYDKYNSPLISKTEYAALQKVNKEVALGNIKVPIHRQ